MVGWVRETVICLHDRHLKSIKCLDGQDFFKEGLAEEGLNVLIGLARSFDLSLNLVDATH